jgi:sarcosine oxidase subunit beta
MRQGDGRSVDAIVIGAGLNGAATSYFLTLRGLTVALVEAERPGVGASGAGVGLLRTHHDNEPETALAASSMPWFREWPERIGGSCGFMPLPFHRFVGHDEVGKLEANVEVQRRLGCQVEVYAGDQLAGIRAFQTHGVGAMLREPDVGVADNTLATVGLIDRATEHGMILMAETTVVRIDRTGGRVTGVATTGGPIAAGVVVIAAGAGSGAIASTCHVRLPVEARPLPAAEFAGPEDLTLPGSFMDPLTDSWLAPSPAGFRTSVVMAQRTVAMPTAGEALDGLARVERRLPSVRGSVLRRAWTGVDSFAPDGKPVIGAVHDVEGLYVHTAAAGKGHKVAPAAAIALAELIVDGRAVTVDIEPFGLARFDRPSVAWGAWEYAKRTIG